MKKNLLKTTSFYSKFFIGALLFLFSVLNTNLSGQSACTCATRWTGGVSWPNSTVGGIIACGSSAETQSNIKNNCVYPAGGVSGMPTSCSTTPTWMPPTTGCKIAWFNYDVKAFASSYQFQIVGSNLNYALFYSTNPTQTLTNGLSGDCSSLKFLRCGLDASSTFSVADIVELPDFAKPTNLYLLVWADDCQDFKFNFKARFGCGETTTNVCKLDLDQTQITTTCNANGTFDLNIPITGANNTYTAKIISGGITYTSNSVTVTNLAATPPVISGTLTFLNLPQTITSPYTVTIKGSPLTGCDKTFQLTAPVCCTPSVTCPTLTPAPLSCGVVAQSGTLTKAEFLALGGGAAIVDCGQTVTITYNDVLSSADACVIGRTLTRTYTINIGTNFTRTCAVVYNINAVPDLILTGTTDLGTLAGCNAALPTNAQNVFTATGNCAGTTIVTTPSAWTVKNTVGCLVTYKRTWSATDACGKTSSAEQTVNRTEDITPPVITATGSTLALGCNPTAAQIEAALGSATATDNCGVGLPMASDGAVLSNGCGRSKIRTWNVTDACGNPATAATRTAIWTEDITPPVITATGSPLALGCNPTAAQINAALGTATAMDNCGVGTPTPADGTVSSTGCSRSQTRTWNVTDACGNPAAAATRTATWTEDIILPVINATGSSLALGCNPTAAQIEAALGTATVTEACSTILPNVMTSNVTSNGCMSSQTRTWNATDACNNVAITVSRTATWNMDVMAPVITATGTTLTLGCNPTAAQIEAALGTATASDNCGVSSPIPSDGMVVSNGCLRSQTRTWTVSDACAGNPATAVSRTVTWTIDITLPVINATGATLALGCNPTAAQIEAALGTATVTEACSNVTPSVITGNVSSPTTCTRSQTRTWNATDGCNNVAATVTRTATWTVDITLPVINATGSTFALGCNPTAADIEAALGTATVTEACSNVTPSVITGNVSSPTTCTRSQTRTWNATDACNNVAATVTRTVTWTIDITLPVINATGSTLALGCNPTAADIEAALGTATVTEACSNVTPSVMTSTISSPTTCTRSQTRTWNATDGCNNVAATVTRTVTWTVDITLPVINATGSTLALGCNPTAAQINAALGTATATDNCGVGTPTPSDGTVSSTGCSRSQTRTWNVSDACGNAAIAVSRTATWTEDMTPPVINATGATLALGCNPNAAQINAALGTATATDNCSVGTPTPSDGTVSSTGCSRSQTRTWNVSDACGNPAIAVTRTVIWTEDIVPPVLVGVPANLTTCTLPTPPTVTATDNCSTPTVAYVQSGTSPNFVRTWTATDGCGNISSASQAITIVQPPIGGIANSDKNILCKVSTEKFTLTVTGNTGVVWKWQMDEDCNGTWVDLPNSNASQIMVIPPSPENANDYCLRYRALIVYADANIVCDAVASAYVEVKVDIAAVGGKVTLQSNTTATSAALCPGESIVLIPFNYFGKIARWEYSYASSPIWYNLDGSEMAPSITVNGSSITETVYYRAVICSGLGFCTGLPSVAYSAAFKINKKLSCPTPDGTVVKNDVKSDAIFTIHKVYPNPSSDYVTLEIEHFTEGVAQIEIMDLRGRIVQRNKQNLFDNVNKIELDINALSTGLYIVRVKDSNKQEAVVKVSKL